MRIKWPFFVRPYLALAAAAESGDDEPGTLARPLRGSTSYIKLSKN